MRTVDEALACARKIQGWGRARYGMFKYEFCILCFLRIEN